MKDPNNLKCWLIDEEAAEIVRQIYDWCIEGYGPTQMARLLTEQKVLIPSAYGIKKGRKVRQRVSEDRSEWIADTVANILQRKEYLGHTVNFKTYRESFRNKKKQYNPEEKQKVFENTHEAIIDADVWEPDKSSGRRKQNIRISYRFVGILPPLERFKPSKDE